MNTAESFVADDERLDVWLLRLPPSSLTEDLDQSVLDTAERERGASFARSQDAALYLSAHIVLRRILGWYLNLCAQDVPFAREECPGCGGPHGRPILAVPGSSLHFSLSHSAGVVLVAVASATVGADAQRTPRHDTVSACIPSLHPRERAELATVPYEERREMFSRIWTRKEAYLKGLGTGLSREPSLDYLGADVRGRPDGWSIIDLSCGPQHEGAVAIQGRVRTSVEPHRLPVEILLETVNHSKFTTAT